MKKTAVVISILLLLGGRVSADDAAPRGTEGPQARQSGGAEAGQRGGHHVGPPPEAFKACVGKKAGTTAHFAGPDGETITGICKVADERLVLRPDHPKENARDGRRGPPPEAYKACEGKKAGSAAQFIDPRGETVKGTCEDEDGKLVLRPEHLRGGRPEQAQQGSGHGSAEKSK